MASCVPFGNGREVSETIILIDLDRSASESISYSMNEQDLCYGRGLVLSLFEKYMPDNCGRYDPGNLLVLVPGLFSGTPAPSACRMLVATAKAKDKGIQISNTSGNMPQKLGSLGIAAIVIKGKAPAKNTVVHISADGVPEYHCPRDGFGDVWGAKNLRALVVSYDEYFSRECRDPLKFRELSKELTQFITGNSICGGALPAYGSTIIMNNLENGIPVRDDETAGKQRKEDPAKKTEIKEPQVRRNMNCAPMCVIGCLNRHTATDGRQYSSPAQVETQEAIKKCFDADDFDLADRIQRGATDIGISATEFVTACKTYAVALGIENGEERLAEWLEEVRSGSLTGRVIASGTYGPSELYSDIGMEEWIDRKAIEDEPLFDVRMKTKYAGLSGFSALDLLYAQIFILENLGFCIFTSFALLDKAETMDIMAGMFEAKTGISMSGEELLGYASECIKGEKEYSEHRWKTAQESSVPRFTKVLYRFFSSREETDE